MRTCVVTGSASGIGAAVAGACAAAGWQVIGVDRAKADIIADLSTRDGRANAVREVQARLSAPLDAVVTCAGIAGGEPAAVIGVNYFGSVELISGLRPLLEASSAPRVVAISSEALILERHAPIVEACLRGDEAAAADAAATSDLPPQAAYASSKYALSRWIKVEAVQPHWAGRGILLNAIAPGVTRTPMIAQLLATPEGTAFLNTTTPMRLGRAAAPEELAVLARFMASPENSFMVGQTVFCDGGAEATLRPEHV